MRIRVHPWLKIQELNPLYRGGVESPIRFERLRIKWTAGSAVEAGLVSDALLHEGAAEVLVRAPDYAGEQAQLFAENFLVSVEGGCDHVVRGREGRAAVKNIR